MPRTVGSTGVTTAAREGVGGRPRPDPDYKGNRVEATETVAAPGLVLGPDGFFHPLEGSDGKLTVTDPATMEILRCLRQIAGGMQVLCSMSADDLERFA